MDKKRIAELRAAYPERYPRENWRLLNEALDEIERVQPLLDELNDARVCRDANRGSMDLMWRLLRLLLPNRKHGCLCDGCISAEINAAETGRESNAHLYSDMHKAAEAGKEG